MTAVLAVVAVLAALAVAAAVLAYREAAPALMAVVDSVLTRDQS